MTVARENVCPHSRPMGAFGADASDPYGSKLIGSSSKLSRSIADVIVSMATACAAFAAQAAWLLATSLLGTL
jgi:hypothetical protein